MRALKDKGIEDLNSIRTRARAMYAKDRIVLDDLRRIEDVANELEAIIVNAVEYDAYGEQIGSDA